MDTVESRYKETSDGIMESGRPSSGREVVKLHQTAQHSSILHFHWPFRYTYIHVHVLKSYRDRLPSLTAFSSPDAKEDFKVPSRSHHSKRPAFPTFHIMGKMQIEELDVRVGSENLCQSVQESSSYLHFRFPFDPTLHIPAYRLYIITRYEIDARLIN
jgi:hypothetical protein